MIVREESHLAFHCICSCFQTPGSLTRPLARRPLRCATSGRSDHSSRHSESVGEGVGKQLRPQPSLSPNSTTARAKFCLAPHMTHVVAMSPPSIPTYFPRLFITSESHLPLGDVNWAPVLHVPCASLTGHRQLSGGESAPSIVSCIGGTPTNLWEVRYAYGSASGGNSRSHRWNLGAQWTCTRCHGFDGFCARPRIRNASGSSQFVRQLRYRSQDRTVESRRSKRGCIGSQHFVHRRRIDIRCQQGEYLDLTGFASNSATGVSYSTHRGGDYLRILDSAWEMSTTRQDRLLGRQHRRGLSQRSQSAHRQEYEGKGQAKQVWEHFTVQFKAGTSTVTLRFINGDSASDNDNGLDAITLEGSQPVVPRRRLG